VVIVPNPTYPIHSYSVIIARADVKSVPLTKDINFIEAVEKAVKEIWPRPKVLIISFPHNPTTSVVDLNFFNEIYELARNYGLVVVHDFAYADLCFDGYKAPSFLEVPGAKELGVEFFTLSKSYNMPGWRVGFMVGNAKIINALKRIKSYLDYGIFQPVQIAAILALNGPQDCLTEIRDKYCLRRDKLVDGLSRAGWKITKPKGTMFVWAEIPEGLREMGSLEFSKMLIEKAKVAVSPGVGFGNHGEGYVRFALVENEKRIMQAVRGIRRALNSY
jgi:alanine-synthesizing transaminase